MKQHAKAALAKFPFAYAGVKRMLYAYRNVKRELGFIRRTKMLQGELAFFEAIKHQIKSVCDVGCRFDVDYISMSRGNGVQYFLFEASPQFYSKLKANLLPFMNEDVTAENIAVGERDGLTDYFKDSESLLRSGTAIQNSNQKLPHQIPITRLDTYFLNRGMASVDFLKTDIEEYDYFALVGSGDFLSKCKYVQCELGIGAPFAGRSILNEDYYALLEPYFQVFLCKDENNPLWKNGEAGQNDLIFLDEASKKRISELQRDGVGFNLVGIQHQIQLPASLQYGRL